MVYYSIVGISNIRGVGGFNIRGRGSNFDSILGVP